MNDLLFYRLLAAMLTLSGGMCLLLGHALWAEHQAAKKTRLARRIHRRIVCAWCMETMTDGEEPISHGICPSCSTAVYRPEMEMAE